MTPQGLRERVRDVFSRTVPEASIQVAVVSFGDKYGVQAWLEANAGAKFHDFAGSVVVHAVGGWIADKKLGYRRSVMIGGFFFIRYGELGPHVKRAISHRARAFRDALG